MVPWGVAVSWVESVRHSGSRSGESAWTNRVWKLFWDPIVQGERSGGWRGEDGEERDVSLVGQVRGGPPDLPKAKSFDPSVLRKIDQAVE